MAEFDRLTPRELAVTELIASGLSNASIAVELGVADATVASYANSIYATLGAPDRRKTNRRVWLTLEWIADRRDL